MRERQIMLRILGLLSLLFWLAVIPFGIGLIPANFISVKRRGPGFVLLAGYFVMWALFEVVAIPAVLFVKYNNFKAASIVFAVLSILCAAAGLWLWYRTRKANRPGLISGVEYKSDLSDGKNDTCVGLAGRVAARCRIWLRDMSWAERIEWLLFFVLLGFQLYKAAAYASFDGDDAYYVVESLIAQQADVMYRILPYTGRPTDLDIRHALAVFPMWIAFVAKRSRIHATIVSHTIMPFLLIPLSYLVYYQIGRQLFWADPFHGKKGKMVRRQTDRKQTSGRQAEGVDFLHRENLPIFMIVMALFQIFGNVSIYTSETFFLTRTWQGKAVAGSLVIPALFWMFLWIFDSGKEMQEESAAERKAVGAERESIARKLGGTARGAAGRKLDVTEKSTAGRKPRKQYGDIGLWLVFVCINMTAGVCSSIAVFLACILMALTALALAVVERDYRVILKMGAVCIPNVVYMAVYVVTAYSYLLK